MTVLIVEDNEGVRRVLRRILSAKLISTWECADGACGVAVYQECHPDIVLMDLRMPRMDGLAAIRKIRSFDPTACIVVLTDYDDSDLREAAAQAGASAYALKQEMGSLPSLLSEVSASCGSIGSRGTTRSCV